MTTIADFLREQAAEAYLRAHERILDFVSGVMVHRMTDEERAVWQDRARLVPVDSWRVGETLEEFSERVGGAEKVTTHAHDGGYALMVARATAFDALQALDEIAESIGWQVPEKRSHGFNCTQGHSIDEDVPARWWMGEGDAVECCCVACMPKQVAKAWAAIEGTADAMMREATALAEAAAPRVSEVGTGSNEPQCGTSGGVA